MNDNSLVRILNWMGKPTEKPRQQPARAPPVIENEEELCQLNFEEYQERQLQLDSPKRKPHKTLTDLIQEGLIKTAREIELDDY
jgi:hypothetical protein